jgi:hypothetical protein
MKRPRKGSLAVESGFFKEQSVDVNTSDIASICMLTDRKKFKETANRFDLFTH